MGARKVSSKPGVKFTLSSIKCRLVSQYGAASIDQMCFIVVLGESMAMILLVALTMSAWLQCSFAAPNIVAIVLG